MKNLANALTLSRILLSAVLLFIMDTPAFLILYLLCGVTDVLDGAIARKTKTVSLLGARLDSIADLAMFLVIFVWMVRTIEWAGFWPFLLGIVLLRAANVGIVLIKHKQFGILHTYLNKATGLLVFLFVPLWILFPGDSWIWICIGLAALSAAEETLIHLLRKSYDPNRKSIFSFDLL